MQKEKDGRLYYTFEFASKASNYIRHALAIVTVGNGRLGPVILLLLLTNSIFCSLTLLLSQHLAQLCIKKDIQLECRKWRRRTIWLNAFSVNECVRLSH